VLALSDAWNQGVVVQADGTFTAEFNVPANVFHDKQVTAGNARIEVDGNPSVFDQIEVDGSMVDAGCGMFDGQQLITSGELTAGPWQAFSQAQRVAAIDAVLAQFGGTSGHALANINLALYYPGVTQSAAEMIESAATANSINPQVVLTMLEKEQQLVRGGYTRSVQSALNYAMGRLPSSTFADQVSMGTANLRAYFDGLSGQTAQYRPPDGSTPWRVGDCHWLMTDDGVVHSEGDGDVSSGVAGWLAPANAATASLWVYNPVFPSRQFGSNYDFWRIWHTFGFAADPLPAGCAGSLVLRAFSPVRAILIDAQGRRAGLDLATGQQLTEIPGSAVTVLSDGAQFISVPSAPDGSYSIEIRGIAGGGNYLLTFDSVTTGGALASSEFGSIIQDGEDQSLSVAFTQALGATLRAALKLNVALSNGNVFLSWTADQGAFSLEQASDLSPAVWASVAAAVTFTNGVNTVAVPTSGAQTWFRLKMN
jgi:hypothetical protein